MLRQQLGDSCLYVALLAEGVDRNSKSSGLNSQSKKVALLAEGVDRNIRTDIGKTFGVESPSSRRAWIEIQTKTCAS